MKEFKIGFSPCPNDCFIFDALVHGRIDTGHFRFTPVMEDVETLNQMAFRGELPVSKLSFNAFAHVIGNYALLDAGAALGFGCGPLLISKREMKPEDFLKKGVSVAIPGKYTTANLLLSLLLPGLKGRKEMIFSAVEDAVIHEEVDAGVIIHENRFTFEGRGLKKVIDLGEWWERETNSPIPLGGIAVRRDLTAEEKKMINELLRKSVEFAFANPKASATFVARHAQAMDPKVVQQHIDLYVNRFSIDLGTEGRGAVELLLKKLKDTDLSSGIFWND